ncbi:MAG: Holliday junction branch migration protein RuvA [Alphaproteobacteria bacterium]|nr:Holliday junction branch migration protein RuvA [Alphaproteobacteria bacterium]
MIGRLAGRIDWVGTDQVLIDVQGVGYEVSISDRTRAGLPGPGGFAVLYTDLLVREDLMQLYGFPSLYDRDWHRLLMTVQGVGAKASLAILGTLGAEGVARAIATGDARAIRAAPGIGPKIAERVILELKAKAPLLMLRAGGAPVAPPAPSAGAAPAPAARAPAAAAPPPAGPGATADALSALVNLGYAQAEAAGAVAAAAGAEPEADAAALIRAALRSLQPKG